jgi:molecular chaperone DnaK (HSP70)
MSEFKPVAGIDFGMTFSKIAYIDENKKPIVILNQENRLETPSVVSFIDKDTFIVGDEAVNRMFSDRENTVSFIKREMGNSNYRVTIHGREYTPQEISALILGKLKRDAEYYFENQGLGIYVKAQDAVITVPAYFGMEQREATKEAAEIAGFYVLNIVNEPTAAALAFGVNNLGEDKTIFVFDLGGGTFDVTILQIEGNAIDILASDGNARLGGKDWDDLLVSYCSQVFKDSHGSDPLDDSYSYQELYERVLKAKKSLSRKSIAMVTVSHEGKKTNVELTREKFEELSKDLVYQCKTLSEHVLEKTHKTWKDIDTILLVGGSTYMPMIRNLVKEMSGKEPSTEVNPDQCVAIGAAWKAWLDQNAIAHPKGCNCKTCLAHLLNKRKARLKQLEREFRIKKQNLIEEGKVLGLSEPEILELINRWLAEDGVSEVAAASLDLSCSSILPYNIGLLVSNSDGHEDVSILFHKDTKLPAECSENFGVMYDGQFSLGLKLIEGRGDNVEDYWEIGDINIEFKLPKKKGEQCNVSFIIPQYGIMKIKFKFENEEIEKEIKLSADRKKLISVNKKKSSTMGITEEVSHDFLSKTYYEIMGVSVDASCAQIKEAYKKKYQETLNIRDTRKADVIRIKLREAYECLTDPDRRMKD